MTLILSSSRILSYESSAGFGTSLFQRLPRSHGAGPSTSLDERVCNLPTLIVQILPQNTANIISPDQFSEGFFRTKEYYFFLRGLLSFDHNKGRITAPNCHNSFHVFKIFIIIIVAC